MAHLVLPWGERIQQTWNRHQFSANVPEQISWPVDKNFPGKVGDRVWLLRKEKGNQGIIRVGRVIIEPLMGPSEEDRQLYVLLKFEKTKRPKVGALIRKDVVSGIFTRKQLNVKAGGLKILEAQGGRLQEILATINSDDGLRHWNDFELQTVVKYYFQLLYRQEWHESPLIGMPERENPGRRVVNRSWDTIECKYLYISTMLNRLGHPFLKGFSPKKKILERFSAPLEAFFEKELSMIKLLLPEKFGSQSDLKELFVDAPRPVTEKPVRRSIDIPEVIRDWETFALENQKRGKAGEWFAFNLERLHLKLLGRQDLADRVVWVSQKNDLLGYDIESFGRNENRIFIEVKTTNGPIDEPFFMTRNERAVAEEKGTAYQIFRIFNFNTKPKIYTIQGPLEDKLEFRCEVFSVTPK